VKCHDFSFFHHQITILCDTQQNQNIYMGVKTGNNTAEKNVVNVLRNFSRPRSFFNRVALIHIKLISNMYVISVMSLLTVKATN